MERIFENLYESVSEACFEDIVSMVEELLDEKMTDWNNYVKTAERVLPKRMKEGHGGRLKHAAVVASNPSEEDIKDYTEKNIDVTGEHGGERIARYKKQYREEGAKLSKPEFKNDSEGERITKLLHPSTYAKAKSK